MWIAIFSETPVKHYCRGGCRVVTEIGNVGVVCLDRESPRQIYSRPLSGLRRLCLLGLFLAASNETQQKIA